MSAKTNTIKQDLVAALEGIKLTLYHSLELNLPGEDVKRLNDLLYKINKYLTRIHYDTVDTANILKRFRKYKDCNPLTYKGFEDINTRYFRR